MFRTLLVLFAAACAAVGAASAEDRWELTYFHDEDKSTLVIADLEFPTDQHGIAAGVRMEENDQEPVVLLTSDGGTKWTTVEIKDEPVSLHFLDASTGWMAAESGVWATEDGGRTWRRILRRNGIARVHFLSRTTGFAVGVKKTMLRTVDGGKTWKPVPEAEALTTTENWTVLYDIHFVNAKAGFVVGRSTPPRVQDRFKPPIWMDPEPNMRREQPSISILMETTDGGQTWRSTTSSVFGRMSRVAAAPDGRALALFEFEGFFEFPSELFLLSLGRKESQRVLRRKDLAVTDIAIGSRGAGFAAGFEPPGSLARTPVPGKLRILRSDNLVDWTLMPADYRAVARRVVLAVRDRTHAWAATDTGMILRLRTGQ